MAYRVVIKRSDVDRTDTSTDESLSVAMELAMRAVRDGICQRVDIYDAAVSADKPVVSHEEILKKVENPP